MPARILRACIVPLPSQAAFISSYGSHVMCRRYGYGYGAGAASTARPRHRLSFRHLSAACADAMYICVMHVTHVGPGFRGLGFYGLGFPCPLWAVATRRRRGWLRVQAANVTQTSSQPRSSARGGWALVAWPWAVHHACLLDGGQEAVAGGGGTRISSAGRRHGEAKGGTPGLSDSLSGLVAVEVM